MFFWEQKFFYDARITNRISILLRKSCDKYFTGNCFTPYEKQVD